MVLVNKIIEGIKKMDDFEVNIKFQTIKKKMGTYIFSVEGNIGSGKSTLVEYLKEHLKNVGDYKIIYLQEPVDVWNTITDNLGVNILEKYYGNQKKYAFSFQMMAYITRLNLLKKVLEDSENCIIVTERCLFTDREIFAKMLHDSGKMEDIEYAIYLKWFDSFLPKSPNSFIYLKTFPLTCMNRINKRNRKGEGSINLDYLEDCSYYHNNWLCDKDDCLFLDGEKDISMDHVYKINHFISKFVKKN